MKSIFIILIIVSLIIYTMQNEVPTTSANKEIILIIIMIDVIIPSVLCYCCGYDYIIATCLIIYKFVKRITHVLMNMLSIVYIM